MMIIITYYYHKYYNVEIPEVRRPAGLRSLRGHAEHRRQRRGDGLLRADLGDRGAQELPPVGVLEPVPEPAAGPGRRAAPFVHRRGYEVKGD